jgi:cytoskeletal protein RodZ
MERRQTMSVVRTVGVGVAITALLTVTTGCGKDEKSSSSSSSSTSSSTSAASSSSTSSSPASSAAPSGTAPLADYTNLLIAANDIGADTTLAPPQQNPGGVAGAAVTFSNTSKTHTIDDLLVVFTDPASAAQGAKDRPSSLGKYVTGAPQPFEVGTNGIIVVGPSPDNSKSVTYVVFAEGKVVVDLEFDSGPNDNAPQDFVLDVAKKQDDAIKTRVTS